MVSRRWIVIAASLLVVPISRDPGFCSPSDSSIGVVSSESAKRNELQNQFANLPLYFEPNLGQAPGSVKFMAHGSGYTLFLGDTEAVLQLSRDVSAASATNSAADSPRRTLTGLSMKLGGAVNQHPHSEGRDELQGRSYYVSGKNSDRLREVPHFSRAKFADVYPGIDQIYYGDNQSQLEFDFVVAPGADHRSISLNFENSSRLEINESGALEIGTSGEPVMLHRPIAYQEIGGKRTFVEAGYVLAGGSSVRFEIGSYDRNAPLIIDPVLVYSTYIGGPGMMGVRDIALDAEGNAYVVGDTTTATIESDEVAYAAPMFSNLKFEIFTDVFIAKVDVTGSRLQYVTYLSGRDIERVSAVAVDSHGNAIVVGSTGSSDFPVTLGTCETFENGFKAKAFVAELDPSGKPIFARCIGGSGNNKAEAAAVDSRGNIYVAGTTSSPDFPEVNSLPRSQWALGSTTNSSTFFSNAFITKLNPSGETILYSTQLGGSADEHLTALAVDEHESAFLAGTTESADFPTAKPVQRLISGRSDGFIAKLTPTGDELIYSTYLGGNGAEEIRGIALRAESAVVVGSTASDDFPMVGALQSTKHGGLDGFIAELSPTGDSIDFATYWGGSGNDVITGLAFDDEGMLTVIGDTFSSDMPLKHAVQRRTSAALASSIFLSKIRWQKKDLLYSTYLGGSSYDQSEGLAVDRYGNAYLVGDTLSGDLRTKNAFQSEPRAQLIGGFVAKLGKPSVFLR